jgi:hypothetical protein
MKRRRGARGFSLLEVAISTAILFFALALIVRLLMEAQIYIAWSGPAQVAMSPELACEQLRNDIRAAGAVAGEPGVALVVLGHSSGDSIQYQVRSGKLERILYDPIKDEETSRPVLDRIVNFRWAPLDDGAVAIDITSWRDSAPHEGRRGPAGQLAARERILTHHGLVVSPRRVATTAF